MTRVEIVCDVCCNAKGPKDKLGPGWLVSGELAVCGGCAVQGKDLESLDKLGKLAHDKDVRSPEWHKEVRSLIQRLAR